jgi:cAMP phosphodiesterase
MKTILVDAVGTFVIKGVGVYQPMFDLLETYPNKKLILSNADDDELTPCSLVNLPYEMFTMKHNPDKGDPIFFKTMLKRYNLASNDVIYFEHKKDAVRSAESVGIKSYFYDANTKDLDRLKGFLDNNL